MLLILSKEDFGWVVKYFLHFLKDQHLAQTKIGAVGYLDDVFLHQPNVAIGCFACLKKYPLIPLREKSRGVSGKTFPHLEESPFYPNGRSCVCAGRR